MYSLLVLDTGRKPEVDQFRGQFAVKQNIFELDVSVADAQFMQIPNGFDDRYEDSSSILFSSSRVYIE